MERAYHLHKAIGVNADILNDYSRGNFGELFGAVQEAMECEAVLAVARVYDKPSKRFPTRCMHRALDLMELSADELPEIVEAYNTQDHLRTFGAPPDIVQAVNLGKAEFIRIYVLFFRDILNSTSIISKVERLKDLRDKRIAHNDSAGIVGPTWESLNELIQQAQEFVGVVGWAFFSTVYIAGDSYMLSSDAERPSRALYRLAELLCKLHDQSSQP